MCLSVYSPGSRDCFSLVESLLDEHCPDRDRYIINLFGTEEGFLLLSKEDLKVT